MISSPSWHSPNRFTPQWLLEPGSMTKRMSALNTSSMEVHCLKQTYERPLSTESKRLGLPHHLWAMIREVELLFDGEIWMYARTVIPLSTLTGKCQQLKYLGTRPLGKILFRDRSLQRSPFEVMQSELWARRSVFFPSGKPLLLTEVFFPVCANSLSMPV